jgi:hypothetical protein
MCPITTLAAFSRSDIAATADAAGVAGVGVGVGVEEDAGDAEADTTGFGTAVGAQDAHTIATAAKAASVPDRPRAFTPQA